MSNVIPLNPQPTFTDNDRLEHLYAAIAFMVHNGKINPLALSLRLPQLDGTEVDITLNEVMNSARRVIDKGYLIKPPVVMISDGWKATEPTEATKGVLQITSPAGDTVTVTHDDPHDSAEVLRQLACDLLRGPAET